VLVGTEVVDGGAVPTRTGGPQWVEQVVLQPVIVEGVQPKPTRRAAAATIPLGAGAVKVVHRGPHHRPVLFAQDACKLVGKDGLARTVDAVHGYAHRIHTNWCWHPCRDGEQDISPPH